MRELGGLVIAKAVAIAGTVIAVVHSGLSAFDQALIIAAAASAITGLFTVMAAWITVKFAARPIHEEVKATHTAVDEAATAAEQIPQQVKDALNE